MRKSLHLIINGKAATEPQLRKLVEQCRDDGHGVSVQVTFEAGDAQRFAHQARGQGYDTVIAAGGDGTLNEVLHGALDGGEPDYALGLLPMGTANDFAGGAGIASDDLAAALAVIIERPARAIDAGQINDKLFLNVATGGFGSQVTVNTDPNLKNWLGKASYLLTGISKLFEFSPISARIDSDDFHWQGDLLALAIGNGQQAGGGIRLCPGAALDDGLLELTLLPPNPQQSIATLLQGFTEQGVAGHQDWVKRQSLSHFTLSTEQTLHLNLDGEPITGRHFDVKVRPQALRFHLP